MNDLATIISKRSALRLAILALASGLMLAVHSNAAAQEPKDLGWVGKAVVPKTQNFTLKDAGNVSTRTGPPAIYHVSQASGNSLLLSSAGIAGWAPIDQVVPVDQAGAFFATQIRANPREPFN